MGVAAFRRIYFFSEQFLSFCAEAEEEYDAYFVEAIANS